MEIRSRTLLLLFDALIIGLLLLVVILLTGCADAVGTNESEFNSILTIEISSFGL